MSVTNYVWANTLNHCSAVDPFRNKLQDCSSSKVEAAGSVVLVLVITLTGTCHNWSVPTQWKTVSLT